ncbi:MAG: hypothetical protein RQ715_08445 [Methylococcales bacterium]|nr:hypothetical protein [Methylococcales bacterium]
MQKVTKSMAFLIPIAVLLLTLAKVNTSLAAPMDKQIPGLVGTWVGENKTYSEHKGYSSWIKTVVIAEQKGRLFKGQFTYSGGTKHFFGVIYPDNTTFTWVSTDSKGYNHGRIHSKDSISACYTESGADATVGCANLTRKNQ